MKKNALFLPFGAMLLFWAQGSDAAAESFCKPYQNVTVNLQTFFANPTINFATPLAQLQTMGQDQKRVISTHSGITLGLTHYSPYVSFRSKIAKMRMPDGTICARIMQVDAEIGYKDVTVYVAKEFPYGTCSYNHIYAHEQKHVAVNAALLNDFAPRIKEQLRTTLHDNGYFRVANERMADDLIHQRLNTELETFSQQMEAENKRRQALIDTPQEYATNNTACSGAIQAVMRQYRQQR